MNLIEEDILLYVDDEEINLELFEMGFSKYFKIVTVDSPLDALEIVRNSDIKIVISDYKMPLMNGMELIQEIKKIKPQTICMIMSAYVESEVVTDKTLLFKYLMKPWKKDEVIEVINTAFSTNCVL